MEKLRTGNSKILVLFLYKKVTLAESKIITREAHIAWLTGRISLGKA